MNKKINLTDELYQRILNEYISWMEANRSKNELFKSQMDIYWSKKDSELLRSNLFWAIMRTIQWTCIINEPDVSWEDQDALYLKEARNFTNMFKYDYIFNKWDFDKYIWIEDVCKYGKFVQLFAWYDKKKNIPIIQRIDPRFVYPYNEWWILVKDYPYFWFDRILHESELNKIWVSKQRLEVIRNNFDSFVKAWRVDSSAFRNITFYDDKTWDVTLHYHYTKIDWLYYLVLMIWWVIIDIKDIPETEWKRIPIAVTWFAYDASDWWWISLCDIVEDSHRTEQLLLNLYKIKVTREATWWNIFIDEEVFLKNKNTLKNQSIKNRWYPVKMRDLTKPISSMVYELPQTQVSTDIYQSMELVKNKAMSESFANATAQWLWLSTNSNPGTATLSKIQKMNASMMTTLQNQILSYWSWEFATLYQDFITYRWDNNSEKIAKRINNSITWTYKKVKKSDIKGNFNILIENSLLKEIEFSEKKNVYQEQYNMLVNDPKTPSFLLNTIRKAINYYSWLDETEIDWINEFNLEEYQCKQDILLLNDNKNIYIPVDCDIQMRLWYYSKAKDTNAKNNAIKAIQFMIAQNLGNINNSLQQIAWQNTPTQPALEWWFNGQDQVPLGSLPTVKQPKIENPVDDINNWDFSVNGLGKI